MNPVKRTGADAAVGGASGEDGTEAAVVADLADGLPVVASGRGRPRLAVLGGAVGVEQVLLGDAHDALPLMTNVT
ncbi:hypothetical protein SALBM135S_07021 [Streptomyces alboniger]